MGVKLVKKCNKTLLFFKKFILCGKIDMKIEISVSEFIPPPDFSLRRLKNDKKIPKSEAKL